ncbi:MAG TPA: hypothetical protein VLV86_07790 [Vicinamibacterales bacterium]|nr:hypothetical protein [Vicinamibacterales bacterium]
MTASGSTVDVPVYVRDASSTPLGVDRPAGSKIQAFSIKVTYAPAAAVSGVTFTRAGITAHLSPAFETSPSNSGSISWLATFAEATNAVPFTSDAPAPGNQVAHLVFTLSSSAAPGSTISLTLDPTLTQLTNEGGTTKESQGLGNLALVSGSIHIPALTIALTPPSLNVKAGNSGSMSVTSSAPVGSATTVALSSSNPSVATVPNSVTIAQGTSSTLFAVVGVSVGQATITATASGATGPATSTVSVTAQPVCTAPDAPSATAPPQASSGSAYSVSWAAVAGATNYLVEEAADPAFSNPTSSVTTDTALSFTHSVAVETAYYYRVTARNLSSGCNVSSQPSPAVTVLVEPPAAPQLIRYIPVAGSTPGSFGTYFRTSVQLYNPQSTPISGKLVYHAAGAAGGASDPSMTYSIGAGSSVAYSDLLPAMGIASGLGSVDMIADINSQLPVALIRIFNDAGAAGTSGFTEDALSQDDALQHGDTGVLLAPVDFTRFRLNIGVRSLADGASLTFTVRDQTGAIVSTSTKTFDATTFVQSDAASMLGITLNGGESISVAVTSGSAIVYGSTIDNTSGDPSAQFARKVD